MRTLATALAVACAVCCAAAADAPAANANCQLRRFATLPITVARTGLITVPIKVEGQTLSLLVDTGSYATALSEAAATRLKLEKQPIRASDWLYGFGGGGSRFGASANMEIAGVPITGKAFNLIPAMEYGVDGILGADILSVFDIDIDYAAGKLGLYSPQHCPGKVVYWTHDPYAVVPFDFSETHRKMRLSVDLDGHSMSAYLDTGASTSVLVYEEALAHFDVNESMLAKDRRFPFKALTFEGGVAVANPDILLFRRHEALLLGSGSDPDMLIGADILRQLHVYISFKEQKLYATGFPGSNVAYAHFVQGMDAKSRGDTQREIAEFSAALDASGLIADQRRRALLDRAGAYYDGDDCKKALADFDSGLTSVPDDAGGRMGRALAKVCVGDKSALTDVDFVVDREPGRASYFNRGLMKWELGDFPAAAEDFSQAYEYEHYFNDSLVWFAISEARAGTLDRKAFAERAARDEFSAWPTGWMSTRILRVFLGRDGAEADLHELLAKDKDPNHESQCRADFYLGEWQLAQQQAAGAKALLQKAAEECPARFIERRAAKMDLARLP